MSVKTPNMSLRAGVIFCFILAAFSCQNAFCSDAVSVEDGLLSVNLKETSLLQVARDIEKQAGVWFRGDETLFQEKISGAFKDLPLEEGLKRILANLNYSLLFDDRNKVAGVMVMGEGTPAVSPPGRVGAVPPRVTPRPRTTTRPTPTVRTRPSTRTPPAATARRPPRAIPQTAPSVSGSQAPDSSGAQSPLPDAFKTQENAPTPGGTVASDGPLPPAFRVIENAPPPGGPVADKEIPEAFKVIKKAPQPGGTPQGSAPSPGDSKASAGAPTPGDTTKSETTP